MQCFIIRVRLYEADNTRLFSELNLLMFPLRGGLGDGWVGGGGTGDGWK